MECLLWICIGLLIYVFFGYPLLLWFLSKILRKTIEKENISPSVTVILPAHNEEKVIGEKIRNTLKFDYPSNCIEIICASDGSTDRTVEIARSLLPANQVMNIADRQGKTNIINKATAYATGDIVVYTDANITLDNQALKALVRNFADPSVGCVAGQLTHVNTSESSTAASVGLYWRYEEFIKLKESATGSIMGADGGIFAIRRKLFTPLPLFIIDDYATSMGILTKGHRVVFEPEAMAFEKASLNVHEELRRKVRIATRSVSASLYLGSSLLRLSPLNLIKFISHRVMRYLALYLLIFALLSNILIVLRSGIGIYQWLLAIQTIFYSLGIIGLPLMNNRPEGKLKYVRLISYFISANAAACLGATKAILGSRVKFWESPKSAR
jgi:cellulose synthase/poly-beta-1,6-N-acetylglucosamine synthase-like glycosyltransferase